MFTIRSDSDSSGRSEANPQNSDFSLGDIEDRRI